MANCDHEGKRSTQSMQLRSTRKQRHDKSIPNRKQRNPINTFRSIENSVHSNREMTESTYINCLGNNATGAPREQTRNEQNRCTNQECDGHQIEE